MPRRLAVVVRLSRFNCVHAAIATFALLLVSTSAAVAFAQTDADTINPGGYLARIFSDSPDEVAKALARAEKLYLDGQLPVDAKPIAIVLHGPEVEIFFKDNYQDYKDIVDLAARLSAFGVVDVRVCETQTGIMGRDRSSVHHFIGTVTFGPTEVKRLLDQQNYVYF